MNESGERTTKCCDKSDQPATACCGSTSCDTTAQYQLLAEELVREAIGCTIISPGMGEDGVAEMIEERP